jgi:two-component system response regulator
MSAHPITILLVEDNPGDIRLTQEALRQTHMPHTLQIAEDGIDALEKLRQEGSYRDLPRPDLVLLDLNLPGKDGREILREIKEDQGLRHIPVIVLTTSNDPQDIQRCYSSFANCYITKPIDMPTFTKVIQQIEQFWGSVARLPS